jgi:hypothetical protein
LREYVKRSGPLPDFTVYCAMIGMGDVTFNVAPPQ